MTWHIKPACPDHLTQMFRVSVAAHQSGYDELIPYEYTKKFDDRYTVSEVNERVFVQKYIDTFNDPEWKIWVAESDSKVVGYTLLKYAKDGSAILKGLFVHPDWQRRGVGRVLFEKSLKEHDDRLVQLTVIKNNVKAIRLYTAHGFKFSANTTSFFGAEQIIMLRQPVDKY